MRGEPQTQTRSLSFLIHHNLGILIYLCNLRGSALGSLDLRAISHALVLGSDDWAKAFVGVDYQSCALDACTEHRRRESSLNCAEV